jgi:hypothetical protein
MPPLSGRLRFVFYSGSLLLFFFLNDGLDFTREYAVPDFYEPRGLPDLLGVPYLAPGAMRALMAGLYIAWVCAAVGFFSRAAKVATALGMLVALGFQQAYVAGASHTHYLLLWSLFCLAFSTSDLDWSVDSWLSRKASLRRSTTSRAQEGLGATGLPRQALLLIAVASYFSAGASKLVDAGLVWANGVSVQQYIASQVGQTSFELVTSLRMWVAGQLWLCFLFSVGSLVLELGAPLALISRRLRHAFIVGWVAMHVVIVVVMFPNFWIQAWCVGVLLTDWHWIRRVSARWIPRLQVPAFQPPVGAFRARLGGALYASLLIPIMATTVLQIEWHPFTHLPMYSSYVAPGIIAGIPEEDFGIESRAREIARGCAGDRTMGYIRRCPWRVPRTFRERLTLELRGPGRPPTALRIDLDPLRYHVIDYLAASLPEADALDASARLAERVRALLALRPAGSLAGWDSFALQYRLEYGFLELASGPLELDG